MSALVVIRNPQVEALLGEATRIYRHGRLNIVYTDHERHSLGQSSLNFGVRDWRHMSVSVAGWDRLPRENGQPPLPWWNELSHLVYGDHPEFTWDRSRDVLQFLPPPSDYVNMAEALHLWQPR